MRNLDFLCQERDRLIDAWTQKSADERVKILVRLMDLDEDIQELINKRKNSRRSKLS